GSSTGRRRGGPGHQPGNGGHGRGPRPHPARQGRDRRRPGDGRREQRSRAVAGNAGRHDGRRAPAVHQRVERGRAGGPDRAVLDRARRLRVGGLGRSAVAGGRAERERRRVLPLGHGDAGRPLGRRRGELRPVYRGRGTL
ncbi:MAG: hypothetical protein AVDCRST_MAG08-1085, partial [uncultured Acetobacteraceae bacterium]